MAVERFTRARKATVTKNYGTHALEYTIPADKEFRVLELSASTTRNIIVELQYTDDGGTTWTNPWDSSSNHLLWIFLGAGIPAAASPQQTYFIGDGTNTKVKIKITNTDVDNDATVFYLIKALERDV